MSLSDELSAKDYLRQRLEPRPGDTYYLILSDLKNALKNVFGKYFQKNLSILDFGCGGSPYRSLLNSSCLYKKADVGKEPFLDFQMDPLTSSINAFDNEFDIILSTQVLEHVESPSAYLSEAFRLVKPKGFLVLSTHGAYQDHPCPKDYWRWTGEGLSREVEKAGFKTLQTLYCTTGPRAAWAVLEINTPRLGQGRRWTTLIFKVFEQFWKTFHLNAFIHRLLDRLGNHYRVVEELAPFRGIYVTLLIVATPTKK